MLTHKRDYLIRLFKSRLCVHVVNGMGSDVMAKPVYRNLLRHTSHSQPVHWATWDWQRHPSHRQQQAHVNVYTWMLDKSIHAYIKGFCNKRITEAIHINCQPFCCMETSKTPRICWYANVAVSYCTCMRQLIFSLPTFESTLTHNVVAGSDSRV